MKKGTEIGEIILRLLRERGDGKTICPSEVARAVAGDDEAKWRPLMEPVREAAACLVAAGKIVVTQKGKVVDMKSVKGAVRLRLK